MQFNSVDFMMFFPLVVAIYFIIPKHLRKIWLLSASYYFYMSWNPWYAILIIILTAVTYVSGILIEAYAGLQKKECYLKAKWIISLSIVFCISVLAFFKYGNFAIGTVNNILDAFHIDIVQRKIDFLLPVGISFYTFQAIGYIVDVYRGEVIAEKNFIRYALFISFFPQLVAGPIERSKNLLEQMRNIEQIKLWNAKRVTSGAMLMVWGLFMKMVIADRISILVDTVFNNFRMYGSTELILAAVGFAIQIYCDFGSYSIIAIGAARIMGFEMMENFDAPYFAQNIREFWSRWHISLSTWFKDYLYIPLGGNRKGKVRKALNLMIVFGISGLWHGANWSFVVWGCLHGLFQVIEDLIQPYSKRMQKKLSIRTSCFSWKLLQIVSTFSIITFAWIFFRIEHLSDALEYIKRIFVCPTPWLLFNGEIYSLGLERTEMNILVFAVVILLIVDYIKYKKRITIDVFLMDQNIWFEWVAIIALIWMIFVWGKYGPTFDAQQFIYFQF